MVSYVHLQPVRVFLFHDSNKMVQKDVIFGVGSLVAQGGVCAHVDQTRFLGLRYAKGLAGKWAGCKNHRGNPLPK